MTLRTDIFSAAPGVMRAYSTFSASIDESGMDRLLLELVRTRVSQINGCANCLNMHTADARKAGESEQRLHLVAAWQDAPVFTDRERAALDWTEHLTLLADRRAPDAVYQALARHFTAEEQVQLTMAIVVINGWNRLAVGFDLFDPKLGW